MRFLFSPIRNTQDVESQHFPLSYSSAEAGAKGISTEVYAASEPEVPGTPPAPLRAVRAEQGVIQFMGKFRVPTAKPKIDVSIGATTYTATLTATEYTTEGLMNEFISKVSSAGAPETVVLVHGEDRKFQVKCESGATLALPFSTGASAASSIGGLLGYPASDLAASATLTASYVRSHSEEWVMWDFVETDRANFAMGLGVAGIELSQAARLRLEANATTDFTSPSFSVELGTLRGSTLLRYFDLGSAAGYRYMRLVIEDRRRPWPGRLKALVLGSVWEPSKGAAPDFSVAARSSPRFLETEQGGQYGGGAAHARTAKFSWDSGTALRESDLGGVEALTRSLQIGTPLFVDLRGSSTAPLNDEDVLYGYVQEVNMKRQPGGLWAGNFTIEEQVL